MGTTSGVHTLLLMLYLVKAVTASCNAPPSYSDRNAHRIGYKRSQNEYAYYRCATGYVQISGNNRMRCLYGYSSTYGRYRYYWSTLTLQCQALPCPNLQTPRNGWLEPWSSAAGYNVSDVVTVHCNPGYKLIGRSSVTCWSNRQWSGEPGSCQVAECPSLQTPNNGRLNPSNTTTYHVHDVVNVTCNNGYQLTGNSRVMCLDDRQWSTEPGVCQVITCPALPHPDNGRVEPACTVGHHLFDNATLICKAGYIVNGSAVVTCGIDGEWIQELGTCREIDCGTPNIVNGEVFIEGGTGYESTISYRCDPDTTMIGEGYLADYQSFCTADEQWDPKLPTCKSDTGLSVIVLPKWPYLGPTNISVTCELVGHELTSNLTLDVAGVKFYNWTVLPHTDNTTSYVITAEYLVTPSDVGKMISCTLTGHKPASVSKGPILFARLPSGQPNLAIPDKDRVVHPGENVTLTCHVKDEGVPAATYVWYRNQHVIDAANDATYTFTAPNDETTDSFVCKAFNIAGSSNISTPVHVAYIRPKILLHASPEQSQGVNTAIYCLVAIVLVALVAVGIFFAYKKWGRVMSSNMPGIKWKREKATLEPLEETSQE